MKYLTAEQVLFIHSRIVDETGGRHGIRDLGLLESAVSRPKATFEKSELYPTVFHKAAALLESLVGNHPFIDGNKRSAIVSVGIFLKMNGHLLRASQNELVGFTLAVATKKVALEDMVAWLRERTILSSGSG